MNAIHHNYETMGKAAPTVFRLHYAGAEIVTMAKLLIGTPWAYSPDADQRFTAAEFIRTMARMVGDPVEVGHDFEKNGAELDLQPINAVDAEVGDLLIFADWDASRPWAAGILSQGHIDYERALVINIGHTLPVAERWLRGAWRGQIVYAYRFRTRRDERAAKALDQNESIHDHRATLKAFGGRHA